MARLYDEVCEISSKNEKDSPYVEFLATFLSYAQVFHISNVHELIQPEHGFHTKDDFPNIVPPYEFTWMEWKIRPDFAKAINFPELNRAGTLTCLQRKENNFILKIFGVTEMMLPTQSIAVFPGYAEYLLDNMGSFIDSDIVLDKDAPIPSEAIDGLLIPTFFAISLLNCKNVTTKECTPFKGEEKRWNKHHKKPLCRFHTLNISSMTNVLKTEGNIKENGPMKALHLCRGHFKTYNEKGLFGKHKGMFYFSPTIRGNKKEGIVLKDYNVIK